MLVILPGNVIHAGGFCFGDHPKYMLTLPKATLNSPTTGYIFPIVQMASLTKQEIESIMKYILMMMMIMYQ